MRSRSLPLLALVLFASSCTPPSPQAAAPVGSTTAHLDTAAAYSTAIADYIAAMDTTTAPLPDTVYIGRHWDFPSVQLPAMIAQRTVRSIEPAASESVMHRPRFTYLNVFGTFTPGGAEFYVVRFAQGMRHRPDGAEDRHVYYRVGKKQDLVLERVGH